MSRVSGSGRRAGRGASWVRWLIGAWLVALTAAVVTGGCALSRSGSLEQNCTADSECDDGNPCTVGACSADGFCSYTSLPDGDRALQTSHDCRTEQCLGGEPVTVDTPADKPVDEPCLTYDCVDMELEIDEHINQEPCELNGVPGVCTDAGDCDIGCELNSECDDGNACTIDTCNVGTGACTNEPLNNTEAPGAQQVVGDCHVILCDDGTENNVIDDTDLPDDDNDCTDELCNQGVATNPPRAVDYPCSVANGQYEKVCDGLGTCVECNGPSQCDHLPSDTFCATRTCTAGVCGQDCTALNTATPAQQPSDCKTIVCDGACSTTQIANAQDLPVDNNDCTQDLCTGMTPSNPPEVVNTACGSQGTLYCDGNGSCVGCTLDAQCPTDVFCRDHYCNNQTQQCDWIDTPNSTPLPSQDQTIGDCQQLQCNGVGGVKSVAIFDPFVDGNDCTADQCSGGNPVNPDRPLNYTCNQSGGSYCDGNGVCVECNSASQCPTAPDCQFETCVTNSCVNAFEPSTTPAPPSYQTTGDCNTVMCDGNGAVNGNVPANDPFDDGNECTSDQCNNGTVINPPVANGTLCTSNGQFCDGVEECQSGTCTPPGDPCDGPDGDGDCTETCREVQNDCNGNDPNATACDDGLFCTTTDQCSTGVCVGTGDPCIGADGDGDCTESCDEGNDDCSGNDPNGSPCDDGLFCTTTDECSSGSCLGTGDPCPGPDGDGDCTETCNEGSDDCSAPDPNSTACDDGQFCTAIDQCTGGSCLGSGDPCPGPDGDGDCTETCNEGSDDCSAPDPNNTACDDGLFCTVTDECSGGSCVGTGDPCPGPDNDGDCTETCNESSDDCTAPDPNNTACDDGLFCTVTDECSGGSCVGAGDPCTGADGDGNCSESCDEVNDHCLGPDPNGSPCDDGQFCTATDQCTGGSCVGAGDPCAPYTDADCTGGCDEGADSCSAVEPSGSPCDDGLYCTGTDTCDGGGSCSNHAGDPCAATYNDADCAGGCDDVADSCTGPEPVTSPCDDGLYCTGSDTCDGSGSCSTHTGDPCAATYNDADCAGGCDDVANSCTGPEPGGELCDDGLFCNGSDSCNGGGVCGIHSGDPCGPYNDGDCAGGCDDTADDCGGPEPNGALCDDAVFCNGPDSCDGSGNCSTHGGDPCASTYGDGDCANGCHETNLDCSDVEPSGSACDDGTYCNGTDTCDGGGVCATHAGDPCAATYNDADCAGGCDEGNGNCNGPEPGGELCDDSTFCNGSDTCDGAGNCAVHSGDPCASTYGDDDCANGCHEANQNCTDVEPSGSACDDGTYCNGTDTCDGSGNCATHSGDPCASTYGDDDCANGCHEINGDCSDVEPSGSFCDDTLFCNGTDTCDGSGACANHSGDPCLTSIGDCDDNCQEACKESNDTCTEDENGTPCNFDNSVCDDICSSGTCTES